MMVFKQREKYLLKKQKYLLLFLIVVLFIATPLTVLQVQKIQEQRSRAAVGDVSVTVNRSVVAGTSQFSPGWTIVDESLNYPWSGNNLTAINNVKSLIRNGIPYMNTHIMGWGPSDPWPDPSSPEPTSWGSLDRHMQHVLDTGATPVLTLMNAPWWMKGQRQADGSTRLLTQSEEWADIGTSSRVLDNQMDKWLLLVQRVAERYMVAPYNVRYFQVWNEMKGYYHPTDGTSKGNSWDYENTAGDPTGPNAKHGYTYMYNQVYNRLKQVARARGIPEADIKVGGPYVVVNSLNDDGSVSHRSNVRGPWGVVDQRDLDVIDYWLDNKVGAEFITIDERNGNRQDEIEPVNGFEMNNKFIATRQWIRQQSGGGATLPIWVAELYIRPYGLVADPDIYVGNEAAHNAVGTDAMIKMLQSGTAVPLEWGGTFNKAGRPPLWTNTTSESGGQPTLFYHIYKGFKDYIPPGTQYLQTTITDPTRVNALATATKTLLVNKTATTMTVDVNGVLQTLTPYDVRWVDTPTTTVPTNTPGAAQGDTYYVDCTSSALDTNSGTSQSSPWRTISKANAATLTAGDRLLFKRGCTWDGALVARWNGSDSNGDGTVSEAEHVFIGAYGSGNKPVIQRNDSTRTSKGSYVAVNITGTYQIVDNIATNLINPYRERTCLQPDGLGVPYGWYVGFTIAGDRNIVRNSEATNLAVGVNLTDNSNNNLVTNNHIHGLNALWNIGGDPDALGGGALGGLGINLHGTSNEIAYNNFDSNEALCNSTFDGSLQESSAPFEVYNASRSYVHHNKAFGHREHFEIGKDPTTPVSEGNILAYNLFVSDKTRAMGPNIHGSSGIFGPINNTSIYNNTMVFTGPESQGIVCGCEGGATVKNNIFVAEYKAGFYRGAFTETNNVYWDYRNYPLDEPNSDQPDPFVQFTTGSLSGTSKRMDPLFVNASVTGGDFRLTSSSPARDAGVSVGYTKDIEDKTVPIGTAIDIGAYEFGTSSTNPTPTVGTQSPTPTRTPTLTPTPGLSGVIINDSFTRTVANGWGSANIGGIYTGGGAATATVNGTQGVVVANTCGEARQQFIDGVSALNSVAVFKVRTNKTATDMQYVYTVMRRQPGLIGTYEYRNTLSFSNGVVRLAIGKMIGSNTLTGIGNGINVSGITHVANTFYWVKSEVTGTNPTTIRMKVWQEGTTEPTTWQLSVTDSQTELQQAGTHGIRAFLPTTCTTAPLTFTVDDLEVTSNSVGTAPTATLTPTQQPTMTPTQTPTRTPTRTPTQQPPTATNVPPTATSVPTATRFSFNVLFHGIGRGGDNATPGGTGNLTPLRPQRPITVEVYNASNILVMTREGSVSYNSSLGNFTGVVDMGTLGSGVYTVKVVSPQYLRKTVLGIISVTQGQQITLPQVALITGNTNPDNFLNLLDYNILLDCYSDFSPARNCADTAKRTLADLTDDGAVNIYDLNLFLRELSVQSGE